MSIDSKAIHDAIVELKEIKEQVAEKKRQGKKKSVKKRLNYLFSSKSQSDIKALAGQSCFDGLHNESDIARAALRLGLKQLQEALADDPKRASGLIHIQKLRAMFE